MVKLSHSKRSKFWQSQLGTVGRVLQLNILDVEKPENFAASSFLENLIGLARSKISLVCLKNLFILFNLGKLYY